MSGPAFRAFCPLSRVVVSRASLAGTSIIFTPQKGRPREGKCPLRGHTARMPSRARFTVCQRGVPIATPALVPAEGWGRGAHRAQRVSYGLGVHLPPSTPTRRVTRAFAGSSSIRRPGCARGRDLGQHLVSPTPGQAAEPSRGRSYRGVPALEPPSRCRVRVPSPRNAGGLGGAGGHGGGASSARPRGAARARAGRAPAPSPPGRPAGRGRGRGRPSGFPGLGSPPPSSPCSPCSPSSRARAPGPGPGPGVAGRPRGPGTPAPPGAARCPRARRQRPPGAEPRSRPQLRPDTSVLWGHGLGTKNRALPHSVAN